MLLHVYVSGELKYKKAFILNYNSRNNDAFYRTIKCSFLPFSSDSLWT